MAEIYQSFSDTLNYMDNAGAIAYLQRMQGRSSAFKNYLDMTSRRKARREFNDADYPWIPSNLVADIRDSNNVNGILQTLQETKHQMLKTGPSSSTRPFGDAQNPFSTYYQYLEQKNQMSSLTLNNTELAQQFHQYQSTSNSEYIKYKMHKIR